MVFRQRKGTEYLSQLQANKPSSEIGNINHLMKEVKWLRNQDYVYLLEPSFKEPNAAIRSPPGHPTCDILNDIDLPVKVCHIGEHLEDTQHPHLPLTPE